MLQAVSFTSFSQKLVYELNFWSCWLTLSVSSDKERRNWYLLSFEEFLSVGLVWIWLWLIKFGKTHYKHHLCLPFQKHSPACGTSKYCRTNWRLLHIILLCMCSQKCSEIIVAHLGYLNYTQYNIFVSFEDLNKLTYAKNITFTVSITFHTSKRDL